MGLDQYAGFRDSNGEVHEAFYWRKHARLQVFFDQMFTEQNKGDTQNYLTEMVALATYHI